MRVVVALALVLAVSGCGEAKRQTVSACLNDHGFLVSSSSAKIVGTSPEGTGFTLSVYRSPAAARRAAAAGRRETTVVGTAVVDASGNPEANARLSRSALTRIRDCLRKGAG